MIIGASKKKSGIQNILIGLMGDVMLGRLLDEHLRRFSPASVWGDLLPVLQSTDFNLANLECALTKSEEKAEKLFTFKTDPQNVAVLREANIKAVNLANNHILDFGRFGLRETIAVLDASGIQHVGAGRNLTDAARPAFIECKGVSIGIWGLTDNEPTWAAEAQREGTAYTDPTHPLRIPFHADVNILSIHWGPNMRQTPSPIFCTFARQAIDAGAQIFHGHSAHIFQGIERYHNGLICYDTGDFLDDYAVDPELRNDQSFFFLAEVNKKGIAALHLLPVLIGDCQVRRAQGNDFSQIVQRMQSLSKPFGTHFTVQTSAVVPYPHLTLV